MPPRTRITSFGAQIYRHSPARFLRAVDRIHAAEPLDTIIVYGSVSYPFLPLIRAARQKGIKLLADCIELQSPRLRLLAKPFLWDHLLFRNSLLHRLDGLIGISSFWEAYARSAGLPAVCIPSLANPDEICPLAPEARSRSDRFTLLYLGIMADRDLPITLVDGVRRALAANSRIRMVVVGKVENRGQARRAVQLLGADPAVRDNVRFTGWVPDKVLQAELASADAFVLLRPQNREVDACFPTRIPEMLLRGKPLLLSAAGDIPRYFRHLDNAWLLEPGDHPEQLAAALSALSMDPRLARSIGERGRETALEVFHYEKLGRRLIEFVAGLRKEPKAHAAFAGAAPVSV